MIDENFRLETIRHRDRSDQSHRHHLPYRRLFVLLRIGREGGVDWLEVDDGRRVAGKSAEAEVDRFGHEIDSVVKERAERSRVDSWYDLMISDSGGKPFVLDVILLLRAHDERRFDTPLDLVCLERLTPYADVRISIFVVESSETQNDSRHKFVLEHLTRLDGDLVWGVGMVRKIQRTRHRFIEREEVITRQSIGNEGFPFQSTKETDESGLRCLGDERRLVGEERAEKTGERRSGDSRRIGDFGIGGRCFRRRRRC